MIIKEDLNKMEPATSEKTIIHNVQVAWRRIKAATLEYPDVWHARAHVGVYLTAWGLYQKNKSRNGLILLFLGRTK